MLLALALSLLFPACGTKGADGLPPAAPIDFARLQRPATPNTALAAPPGFQPVPDIAAPAFSVPPARLYAVATGVAAAQPRTFLQSRDDAGMQAHYVARTAVLNFPDLVALQVVPAGTGSSLILWSRSVYGHSDLGTNRKRVTTWLAALDAALRRQQDATGSDQTAPKQTGPEQTGPDQKEAR